MQRKNDDPTHMCRYFTIFMQHTDVRKFYTANYENFQERQLIPMSISRCIVKVHDDDDPVRER